MGLPLQTEDVRKSKNEKETEDYLKDFKIPSKLKVKTFKNLIK